MRQHPATQAGRRQTAVQRGVAGEESRTRFASWERSMSKPGHRNTAQRCGSDRCKPRDPKEVLADRAMWDGALRNRTLHAKRATPRTASRCLAAGYGRKQTLGDDGGPSSEALPATNPDSGLRERRLARATLDAAGGDTTTTTNCTVASRKSGERRSRAR